MEWDREAGWGQDYSPDDSPRRYRRAMVGRAEDRWERLDRSHGQSMDQLDRMNKSHDRSMNKLDRVEKSQSRSRGNLDRMDRSHGWSIDTLDRMDRSHSRSMDTLDRMDRRGRSNDRLNRSPSRSPRRRRKGSRGKLNRSQDRSLGRSTDKSLNRSMGDLDSSLSKIHRSPGASPRRYRREELSRSLDLLLDDSATRSHSRSLDRLLEDGDVVSGREVGGSPQKSREALTRPWDWSQESLDRLGEWSPAQRPEGRPHEGLERSGGRPGDRTRQDGSDGLTPRQAITHPTAPRLPPTTKQTAVRHRRRADREYGGRCVEVALVCTHVLTALVSLVGVITLGVMATNWQMYQEVCPLFVTIPPGFYIRWGNEDLTACNVTAFLPLLVVALSLVMGGLHCGVVKVWHGGTVPGLAASRGLAVVLLIITVLEAALALATTITLTEGFRQTCISFDLNLSWGEVAPTCHENYQDRDSAYMFNNLHTFALILTGMICGWTSSVLTIILVLLNTARARLCSCSCCH